jgi:hypothetical protein
MGYLTILVGFLQMLYSAVNVNNVVLRTWLGLVNGQLSGTGLVCLIPELRNLVISLLVKSLLPFGLCILVVLSIGIGETIWIIVEKKKSKQRRPLSSLDETGEMLLGSSEDNDGRASTRNGRYYPWSALATSVSLSIIQFFYFNISMTCIGNFVADVSRRVERMMCIWRSIVG